MSLGRREIMNPVDWVAWIYGKFVYPHAIAGGFIFVGVFCVAGLLLWIRGIDYFKEHQLSNIPPLTAPVAEQKTDHPKGSHVGDSQRPPTATDSSEKEAGATVALEGRSNHNTFSGNRFINVPNVTIRASDDSKDNLISDNLIATVKETPLEIRQLPKYKKVSNKKLTSMITDFANEMRRYEADFEEQHSPPSPLPRPNPFVIPSREEQHRENQELIKREKELSENFELEASKRYLVQATEYRNEILWRLNKNGVHPALYGSESWATFWAVPGETIVDPHSVKETATYLENLARQLP